MDIDVFPLAEVQLKVEDVAIKFENDDNEHDNIFKKSTQMYNTPNLGMLEDIRKTYIKTEPVLDESLPTKKFKVEPQLDPAKKFPCEQCGKSFTRSEHLKVHIRTHTGERPFDCDLCPRSFAKRYDLKRHKQCVHSLILKFFICEECGRQFSRKDHLKCHLLCHKNQSLKVVSKMFTCETCGRSYERPENLKKHQKRHSENTKSAEFLAMRVTNEEELSSDAELQLLNERVSGKHYPCELCGRLFSRTNDLRDHERTHTGERPFECSECDNRFGKKFVLLRHMRNVHGLNVKKYTCSECGKNFSRKDHFKNHLKKHLILEKETISMKSLETDTRSNVDFKSSNETKDKVKQHPCEFCGKIFSRTNDLKNHERTHTGERPFKCGECNSRFTRKYVMTRHVETVHRGKIKYHVCSDCNRTFTRTDHFKAHLRKHILGAAKKNFAAVKFEAEEENEELVCDVDIDFLMKGKLNGVCFDPISQ